MKQICTNNSCILPIAKTMFKNFVNMIHNRHMYPFCRVNFFFTHEKLIRRCHHIRVLHIRWLQYIFTSIRIQPTYNIAVITPINSFIIILHKTETIEERKKKSSQTHVFHQKYFKSFFCFFFSCSSEHWTCRCIVCWAHRLCKGQRVTLKTRTMKIEKSTNKLSACANFECANLFSQTAARICKSHTRFVDN